jgi:hypothetical protein
MIVHGQRLAGRLLDAQGQAALDTVWDMLSEHEMHTNCVLKPGQIQSVSNFHVAHRRTTYEDWEDPQEKRHLVRIFLRDFGRRSFDG